MPGAEVLRRVRAVRVLADVRVHVVRADRRPARAVSIAEQLWPAASPLQRTDHRVRARVDDPLRPRLAAFGHVVEHHHAPVGKPDVPLLQCREAEAAVAFGVLLAADPEKAPVEQPRRAGEQPLPRQPALLEVAPDGGPELGQRARELDHALELFAVPLRAPDRVVEVLQPSGRVAARGLEMTVRPGTDLRRRSTPVVSPGPGDARAARGLQGAHQTRRSTRSRAPASAACSPEATGCCSAGARALRAYTQLQCSRARL